MHTQFVVGLVFVLLTCGSLTAPSFAQDPAVKGTFVLDGMDAKLTHVRVARFVLDEGTKKLGYAILMSAKPATGDINSWRMADPGERGNFVFLVLEPTGDVWIAELGHTARKGGRFGVVLELKKAAFEVKNDRLTGHYRTNGEQRFGDSRYTIDLTFTAPIEGQ